MSSMFGMDIQQVSQLSGDLRGAAARVDSAISRLNATLQGVAWVGPDADRFREHWAGTTTPELRKLADGLREASGDLANQASAQVTASS